VRLDPLVIRSQVEKLLHDCPEMVDDPLLRADMIEAETDLFEYIRKILRKCFEADAYEKAVDIIAQQYHLQGKDYAHRQDALRRHIFNLMQSAGLQKMELPEATLSIRRGQQWAIVTQEEKIPDEYWRVRREPDKTKIRAGLLNGTTIPGAILSNAEPSLAIRSQVARKANKLASGLPDADEPHAVGGHG
jgi:hypothetical protein